MKNQPPPPYPFWTKHARKRVKGNCAAARCKRPSTLNHKDTELCDKHWEQYCDG